MRAAPRTDLFGDDVAKFKVGGKMFALVMLEGDLVSSTSSATPDLPLELRGRYPGVQPGYHANKRRWDSVHLDGSIPASVVVDGPPVAAYRH